MTERTVSWCFTAWVLPHFKELDPKLQYIIWGEEICPKTKKLHWQGFLYCKIKMSETGLLKLFKLTKKELYIKPRYERGNDDAAATYCKKDSKHIEFGKLPPGQGSRTDIKAVADALYGGTTISEIMRTEPTLYVKYRGGFKDIAADAIRLSSKAVRELEIILITGPTRAGKTWYATQNNTEEYFKTSGSRLGWWNGYQGEKTLVIDEYNNDVSIGEILSLLDVYQYEIYIKGSNTYCAWTKVFITTNLELHEIHSNAKPAHRLALFERITTFMHFQSREVRITLDRETARSLWIIDRPPMRRRGL